MTDTVKEANEITLEKVKEWMESPNGFTYDVYPAHCAEEIEKRIDWLIAEVEEAKKLLLSAWHLLDIAEPNAKITEELEAYLRKNLK